jgi:hypothetical protein
MGIVAVTRHDYLNHQDEQPPPEMIDLKISASASHAVTMMSNFYY